MSSPKTVWVLVGGNGAGKTTFFNDFLKSNDIHFVNADIIERETHVDSYEAAREARERFQRFNNN